MAPITIFHCSVIIVCLLFIRVNLIVARSDPNNGFQVDICANPEQLRCPDGQVISVQEVRCGDSRRPCVTSFNQSLTDICHGHQTCSNIGLQDMFSSHCGNHHMSGVRCKFRCVPGENANCRSNICDQDSPGLMCPSGSTLHIRRVTCSDGSPDCSWGSYNLLTSLCEGSTRCEASGLRALLSPRCDVSGQTKKQVMVEYLCVPAKLIHKSCSSFRYRPITPITADFGIIRSPKPPKTTKNEMNKKKQCKWMIAFQKKQPVRINVLLVQSMITKTGWDPNFLRIKLVSCVEKKVMLRSFGNLEDSSVQLISCGPIKITSSTSSAQGDGNNQFLISFQGFSDAKAEDFLSSGLSTCTAPPPPIPRVLTVQTKSDVSHNALHDSGPDDLKSESDGQSGSFKITIKMLLLYIFLGVLILVLATALITVLVRYRRISLPKNKYADSTENVILWRRYEDTAMDVFQQNGVVEHAGSYTSDPAPNSDQVIATVHHDPVPDHEELDHRTSCGSGISSFLPPKRDSGFKDLLDTFQLGSFPTYNTANNVNGLNDRKSRSVSKHDYYELPEHGVNHDIYQALEGDDEDAPFNSHYSNPNSLTRPHKVPPPFSEEIEHHLMATEDHQPLVKPEIYPKDDYHYCVNNDEYAVVKKSRKPHKADKRHSGAKTMNGIDGSNVSVDFRPTSGPYDKTSYSASNSNRRKSREKTWRDDL